MAPSITITAFQLVKMRWGKIVSTDANENSQAVADSLEMRAAHGIEEATAAPIVN